MNHPRFNEIFCQQSVTSGYTINSLELPHLHINMVIVSTPQRSPVAAIRSNYAIQGRVTTPVKIEDCYETWKLPRYFGRNEAFY